MRRPAHAAPSSPRGTASFSGRIEVALIPTVWDIYRSSVAERWHRRRSADASIANAIAPWIVLLYLIAESINQWMMPKESRNWILNLGLWVCGGWLLWWWAKWLVNPLLEAVKQERLARSEPLIRYEFSAAGMKVLRLDHFLEIAWPGIRRVRETLFSFLIYPHEQSPWTKTPDGHLIQTLPLMKTFLTVPKHCFPNDTARVEFRNLARCHVNGEVLLRS